MKRRFYIYESKQIMKCLSPRGGKLKGGSVVKMGRNQKGGVNHVFPNKTGKSGLK